MISRRGEYLLFLSALLWGCAATQRGPSSGASNVSHAPVEVQGIEVTTRDVPLSSPPAQRYGGETDHTLGPAEMLVVETLTRSGLHHEPRLSKAARELARTAPEALNIPGSLVDGVLEWAGLISPRPRISVVEFSDPDGRCTVRDGNRVDAICANALQSVVEEAFASPLPRVTLDVGVGVVPVDVNRGRIIVAITERNVELAPFPSSVEGGEQVPLRGRLLSGRSQPQLELVDARGQGHEVPVAMGSDGAFASEVGCDYGDGAYQVELLATGPYGAEVVANFRLYCGTNPPLSVQMTVENLDTEVGIADIERANFQALNQTRARYGLQLLEWDDSVVAVARAHSEDMSRNGFVGHRSPSTGLAGDRFRAAGIKGAVIRENIARGYGPNGIHEGLMGSPGHRVNILSEDVTHIGIGAVFGALESDAPGARRPIFLTQNFYAPRGGDLPENPSDALRSSVDSRRDAAGSTPIQWDQELCQLAQNLANGVARNRDEARRDYQSRLDRSSFRAVETQQTIASSFAALTDLDFWSTAVQGMIGIGVARITEGEHQDALVLIISVGRR